MSKCTLCFSDILKNSDRNLVEGKGGFKVKEELLTLPFKIEVNSPYICKSCVWKLKKRRGVINNLKEVEAVLVDLHQQSNSLKRKFKSVSGAETDLNSSVPSKIIVTEKPTSTSQALASCHLDNSPVFQTSTPTKDSSSARKLSIPDINIPIATGNSDIKKTVVQVKIEWPSKTKVNTLPEGLESLGKMLCRGTYSQIASAVWKNPILKKHVQQLFLKDVDRECTELCSKKSPSCLLSPKAQDVKNFSFKKLEHELESKAPCLSAVLWTASLRKSKREGEDPFWMPSVCMSAATLLKNRYPCMSLLQLMNTITIYHSGLTVSINVLSIKE